MKRIFYISCFLTIACLLGGLGYSFYAMESRLPQIRYDQLVEAIRSAEAVRVEIKGGQVLVTDTYDRQFETHAPDTARLLDLLEKHQVDITSKDNSRSPLWNFFTITLPIITVLLIWFLLTQRQQAKNEEQQSAFATKRMVDTASGNRGYTFDDVAGIPEVLDEVREIVEFLKNTEKFSKLGATIPKGVLLQGPPGTGKTLLAKAIAGEATTSFYSFSGSDFVEMFVGVGASRVRELFQEAKKNTPCVVFIDEIDAVGSHRSSGGGVGGQEERGQTLNALLVEMDGFARDDTIIVLAATNRPDVLDPALLRPGRFDRVITILAPDVKGRRKILEVHAAKVKVGEDVDLDDVARSTPGFTGAELANLVNEAALVAARKGKPAIGESDFQEARDRILIGVERKSFVLSQDDKRTIAYHEAGHAVLAKFLPHADPIQKITIIPRGKAMGHTQQQSLSDRHAYTKEYLRDRITILMGGRAAEELCLMQQSTGSEDDLLRATEIATKMVCQWGMNELLGPLAYARGSDGFLGDIGNQMLHSEITGKHIDMEVRKLIDSCYQEAMQVLLEQKSFLNHLADILLQTETIDEEEMQIIFDCSVKKDLNAASNQPAIPQQCLNCPAVDQCTHLGA